ncbi:hypothetical protein FDUTEX481_00215 [Tolypothrix sp. PCC 7601]|nr:hypothetical protein FDUTEX481_00215 [Tolypothrix sp. PCC 7601]
MKDFRNMYSVKINYCKILYLLLEFFHKNNPRFIQKIGDVSHSMVG